MSLCVRVSLVVGLVLSTLVACQTRQDRERDLTGECKREPACKELGLCTGLCLPEPCRCVAGSSADCSASKTCASSGQCSAKDGKCVVASNADCARTAQCAAAGFCTAQDGVCAVGSDADCSQSQLCKDQRRCVAKSGACIDKSFHPALLNPTAVGEQAPEKFKVKFVTTKGDFVVEATRSWAPLAADRFYNLVKINYFTNVAFYKVDGIGAEFGIHGNPEVTAAWREAKLQDESAKQHNARGYVTFPRPAPKGRWAPLLIHLKDNHDLDRVGYAPFGKVTVGMNVIDSLEKTETEGAPSAKAPETAKLQAGGDAYLKASFPKLDYVVSASLQ